MSRTGAYDLVKVKQGGLFAPNFKKMQSIGGGALSPVLFGALGDHTSVPTALLALAAVLLLTLPLAWKVQRGLAQGAAT